MKRLTTCILGASLLIFFTSCSPTITVNNVKVKSPTRKIPPTRSGDALYYVFGSMFAGAILTQYQLWEKLK